MNDFESKKQRTAPLCGHNLKINHWGFLCRDTPRALLLDWAVYPYNPLCQYALLCFTASRNPTSNQFQFVERYKSVK